MNGNTHRIGILLMNTGSTAAPRTAETREYLRQFLSDPRIIDKHPLARWLIVNLFILPTRPKQSAEAYSQIWTEEGSPLIVESERLKSALQERLPDAAIELGMAYGDPSIPDGLDNLIAQQVDRIIVAPMFPQYASATNGSTLECVYRAAAKKWNVPPVSALPPFYDNPGFIDAWVEVARPHLESFQPDRVLLSYHGLPERHCLKSDPTGQHCLKKPDCCDTIGPANRQCYRAHCYATTRLLVERLGLGNNEYTLAFQSRLGREPWLKPATDEQVVELAEQGVKRLAVLCPSFTADCLETLEEIGLRAKEDFLAAGGEEFLLVPCLNNHPAWVDALANLLEQI